MAGGPNRRLVVVSVPIPSSEEVCDALLRPASYPHRPAEVEVCETHISWVFLAGERAYKLKKPLVLDFLDYGTPERRRTMCEEVRLNCRLAPGTYLGVRGVALRDSGAELIAADDAGAIDFVVEMRRYEERTLAARLKRSELAEDQVRAIGCGLARFHDRARRVTDPVAPLLAVERRFERNLHELLACVEQRGEVGRVQALERFAHAYITRHAHTFQARASLGRDARGARRPQGGARAARRRDRDRGLHRVRPRAARARRRRRARVPGVRPRCARRRALLRAARAGLSRRRRGSRGTIR